MAIDPTREKLFPLSVALRLVPKRRAGRKMHLSCAYRWTTTGCKGIVLESIQVGGTRCTSREAISRFFTRLTAQAGLLHDESAGKRRLPAQRDRAVKSALKTLARRGA